jgi:ABC-type transporter Mla subunit MlaD
MSISRAQSARLGVFVATGSLLLAGFLDRIARRQVFPQDKKIHAYFVGESVSGLEQSATVKYLGRADRQG